MPCGTIWASPDARSSKCVSISTREWRSVSTRIRAEVAYVLEGTLEYQFEGEPPATLKAGEALFIPAGTIHAAKNVGTGNAAELATYIVEKGKPLVVLAR
jgi:mannose-6-phosphate isomerase-like protein (cupin superfamily)